MRISNIINGKNCKNCKEKWKIRERKTDTQNMMKLSKRRMKNMKTKIIRKRIEKSNKLDKYM